MRLGRDASSNNHVSFRSTGQLELPVLSLIQDSRLNWNELIDPATIDTTQNLCQELVDDIIGYLHDDKATLCACSLTSRAMVAAAQRGLFSEIYARPHSRGPDSPLPAFIIQRLVEMLPHIAIYVKSLYITFDLTSLEIMMPHIFYFTGVLLKLCQIFRFSLCLYPLADLDFIKLQACRARACPAQCHLR